MESGQTARELMDRREIRENVTHALASLPVSSLLDVDQISSALSQSTVSNHLVCFLIVLRSAIFKSSVILKMLYDLRLKFNPLRTCSYRCHSIPELNIILLKICLIFKSYTFRE